MNSDDLQFIERHIADAGRVELRALHPGGHIVSGLFDNAPPLVAAIHDMRHVANLYYTAQAPALRSVPNRMCTPALGNADIASYARIVFDLDTVRKKDRQQRISKLRRWVILLMISRSFFTAKTGRSRW